MDFSALYINLSNQTFASLAAAEEAGAPVVKYGVFINTVLDFIIIALVIFLVIRQMNRLKKQEEAPPAEPTTKNCSFCMTEIPIKATRCPHCTSELKAA